MSAILRLMLTWFTATPLIRGLAVLGGGFIAAGIVCMELLPPAELVDALRGNWNGTLPFITIMLPWAGIVVLLASSALMPTMAERIALGRTVWMLPYGRVRLLASVLLTGLLLAAVFTGAVTIAFSVYFPWDTARAMFTRTLVMFFIDLGLLYVAIWFAGKTQGIWRLAGTLAGVLAITIPLRLINPDQSFSWMEWLGIGCWLAFGLLLLAGGRMRHLFADPKRRVLQFSRRWLPGVSYREHDEFGLMLGITRPWLIALGQIVPIAILPFVIRYSDSWLAVLMIFGALSGAITSQAAARSRRFWLRVDSTRAEIARQVELAFWRFNASSLVVLLVSYGALAVYANFTDYEDFTVPQILHGWALLTLGCAACTCLGLMITRGLGWLESVLCVLTLSALTIASVAVMRGYLMTVIELEVSIAVLAIAYRYLAMRRWSELDWMRCRA